MPEQIKNDRERRLWTLNDQGLYSWWKSTGYGTCELHKPTDQFYDPAADCQGKKVAI